MPRRSILSVTERDNLLALPDTEDGLIRYYTFSDSDQSLIGQRRGNPNRLGFAIQLCLLRYPGQGLAADAVVPSSLLQWVATQLRIDSASWLQYAQREETRREHPQANSHVGGRVDDQPWHEHEHSGRDNRGKLFVNFNPADRVIGVSAVAGIGWQGIPSKILNENTPMFANVYQRAFARNTTVGDRSNYWFDFFNLTTLRQQVGSRAGGVTTDYGVPLQTQGTYLQTFDGKPSRDFWTPASPSVAGVVPEMATPADSQRVWINAPVVPEPVKLGGDFQEMPIRFDGAGLSDNGAQAHDFSDFKQFYQPVDVTKKDVYGQTVTRKETPDEVAARMAKYGQQPVAQTNHGQILEYDGGVSHVLAYDITVGFGHAFGDQSYWNYLKDMADWKISDPYYKTGQMSDVGGYPNGLDTETNKEQREKLARWQEMWDKKAPPGTLR